MPFLSADDTLSPTSSTLETPHIPRGKFQGRAWEDSDQVHNYQQVINAIPKQGHITKQKNFSRPRIPELNIVTDFPSPSRSAKWEPESTAKRKLPKGYKDKRDPTRRSKPQNGVSTRSQEQESKLSGNKGPINNLKRASSKAMELSPSDRLLVIGLQVPSTRLADDGTSPSPTARDPSQSRFGSSLSPLDAISRSHGDGASSVLFRPRNVRGRQRAVSSIYSVASHYPRGLSVMAGVPAARDAPPVPTVQFKASDILNNKARPASVVSVGTQFDEEEDLTPQSGESQKSIRRMSIDTMTTARRSKGWWNELLSPLFPRSNNIFLNGQPSPQDHDDTERLHDPDSSNARRSRAFSDVTDVRSSGSSIWTVSDTDFQPAITPLDDTINRGPSALTTPVTRMVLSPEDEHLYRFGEAAEYYRACWHDQNSPNPYFKCQNHNCCVQKQVPLGLPRDQSQDAGERARGLLEIEAANPFREQARREKFIQTPANRFSAAFGEATEQKSRPKSDFTVFEEDPETTPEIAEARAAPLVRAGSPVRLVKEAVMESEQAPKNISEDRPRQLQAPSIAPSQASTQRLPAYSPPRPYEREYVPISLPEPTAPRTEAVSAFEPSPNFLPTQASEAPRGPNASGGPDVSRETESQAVNNYHTYHYWGPEASNQREAAMARPQLFPPTPPISFAPPPGSIAREEASREQNVRGEIKKENAMKKEEKKEKKKNKKPRMVCFGIVRPKDKKKRRRLYCLLISALLAIIILCVVLAMVLTRKTSIDSVPVQSSWLNITGFPPIPTGISTIAQPDAAVEDSQCIQPTTMWSCALPPEQQASVAPNDSDQPNFRIEILFQNNTGTNAPGSSKRLLHRSTRRRLLQVRQSVFTPNPAPPSQEDQIFLGNTTDGIVEPADGEPTPFFISFLNTAVVPIKLHKRQDSGSNTTNPFPNLDSVIPAPDLNPNQTAAPANLLPYPTAQPLRLYNRGLATEHYGFYTYFDRSVFLRSTGVAVKNNNITGAISGDEKGGAAENVATARCTWRDTRFLVQIWTNSGSSMPLLPGGNSTADSSRSSANDFSRPGSFPYPITISLDRHGGDLNTKEVYCYGVAPDQTIADIPGNKLLQQENRSVGGTLVNPALGPFGDVTVGNGPGQFGGIDGGTGGCRCQWRNWQ